MIFRPTQRSRSDLSTTFRFGDTTRHKIVMASESGHDTFKNVLFQFSIQPISLYIRISSVGGSSSTLLMGVIIRFKILFSKILLSPDTNQNLWQLTKIYQNTEERKREKNPKKN